MQRILVLACMCEERGAAMAAPRYRLVPGQSRAAVPHGGAKSPQFLSGLHSRFREMALPIQIRTQCAEIDFELVSCPNGFEPLDLSQADSKRPLPTARLYRPWYQNTRQSMHEDTGHSSASRCTFKSLHPLLPPSARRKCPYVESRGR